MLHGDCYHRAGNSLAPYRQALDAHLAGRGLLGYLDHPQSASYGYGWTDLDEQVAVHAEWLDHLARFRLWRPNLVQALDFTQAKAATMLRLDEAGRIMARHGQESGLPPLAATWRGACHVL
jgi:hypothetical protein